MVSVDKRRMCPNCRAFIDAGDRVCPYCDAKVGPRAIERRSPGKIAGLIPAAQFTTAVILLINISLYIATVVVSTNYGRGGFMSVSGEVLVAFGAKYGPAIAHGEYWRLITAGFLHGGLIHILMNSWVLLDVGGVVEQLYGTARFIVFYFVSTICGFLLSTWWNPGVSIGASAGIFGLIGVMIAFGMAQSGSTGQAIRSHFTQWAVYGFVMGLLPGFRVDNAAHLGGLAGGFITAYIAGSPKLYESWRDAAWKVAAGICLVLTALSFLAMFAYLRMALSPATGS